MRKLDPSAVAAANLGSFRKNSIHHPYFHRRDAAPSGAASRPGVMSFMSLEEVSLREQQNGTAQALFLQGLDLRPETYPLWNAD